MTNTTATGTVTVYLGDPFENPQEERFLSKLRRDLLSDGTHAVVLANFVTTKNQRQIDFLVLTDFRLVHVELKSLNPRAPLIGKCNGPWQQRLPGGPVQTIEPNPYRQALDGTYAIGDVAEALAKRGSVPLVEGHFYKHIDTVVCIDPETPAGSQLDRFTHVEAVSYSGLLERLTTVGPRTGWALADWEKICRHLGLYLEEDGSPSAQLHRSAKEALDEYAYRFVGTFDDGLPSLVPVGFAGGPGSAMDILADLQRGGNIVLTGASGSGKSHTARHLALEASRRGALVLWLRADEYEKGRLGVLLSKAAAPYSSLTSNDLLSHAGRSARQVLVVLDGLNECPARLRSELLGQLQAFTLRHPATLVVTTTAEAGVPTDLVSEVVTFRAPQADERQAILSSYGAKAPDGVSTAFTTAFELSVAAKCQAQLSPDANPADLFDS